MAYLEPNSRASLLYGLHCILDLEDAALWAPGNHVGIILRGKIKEALANVHYYHREPRKAAKSTEFWRIASPGS
jgi:hypothetical protein